MARPTKELLDNLRPGVAAASSRPVTFDVVVIASSAWLVFALATALAGWLTAEQVLAHLNPLLMLVAVVGLTFLDVAIYRRTTPPVGLMALSLGAYAYFVGAVSAAYTGFGAEGIGLIGSAALGTVGTGVAVIALYKARILRADTPKFRAVVTAALGAYFVVVCASLLISAFGGASLFGAGVLGWVLCFAGAVLAALSLVWAAADIDLAVRHGVPATEASRLGWAFISTLLWLYLEILRLLARARD